MCVAPRGGGVHPVTGQNRVPEDSMLVVVVWRSSELGWIEVIKYDVICKEC